MSKLTQRMQLEEMLYIEHKEGIQKMVEEIEDKTIMRRAYWMFRGLIDDMKTLKQLRGDRLKEDVAKELNISTSSLTAYEEGTRIPRDEVKKRFIDFYGTHNIKFNLQNK